MPSYVGLYYPFIHFRNEAWLKLTALYWDEMARIVPGGYDPSDSHTVNVLIEELDFIQDIRPQSSAMPVSDQFIKLLTEHYKELQTQYAISKRNQWPDVQVSPLAAYKGGDPKLEYISTNEKMSGQLHQVLKATGLGLETEGPYNQWIGMHPKLAALYMTTLAEHIAQTRGLHPVADDSLNYLAITGITIERLAHALLNDINLVRSKPTRHEIESRLVTVAFEYAVPRDIANVPVEKIVTVRRKYRDEFVAFQTYVSSIVHDLRWLQEVSNQEYLQNHLQHEYEKRIKPQVDSLHKVMRSVGIKTVVSSFSLESYIMAGIGGWELAQIDPVLGVAGAIALTTLPVLREKKREIQGHVLSSPAAYLFHLQEDLKPATLTSQIAREARKFVFKA